MVALPTKIKSILVRWEKSHKLKITTDGSKDGDGVIGSGGIVRDVNGSLIMAFAKPLE